MKIIRVLLILVLVSCANSKKTNASEVEISTQTTEKDISILKRMEYYNIPGVSIAVVNDRKILWTKGYGIANSSKKSIINPETLFQAASISKPITALSVLKLLEEGKVDLNEDVNIYLKDWKIPENKFTKNKKVTLKRLLTHTAGITVHGFPGYKQDDEFPSIISVLNGEGNTSKIYVDNVPGSLWRYSGGGYTIIEKIIEDVSGTSFEDYMDKNILKPLGMNNSTYKQPLPQYLHSNASAAYDRKGKMIKGLWHNYPEQAAAGLWTTPSDLAKYCIEIQEIMSGKDNGILSKETIERMLTKNENNWGLGLSLKDEGDLLKFRHGGKNKGFTNDLVSFTYQGKALIILTNGDNGSELIKEIQKTIFKSLKWN